MSLILFYSLNSFRTSFDTHFKSPYTKSKPLDKPLHDSVDKVSRWCTGTPKECHQAVPSLELYANASPSLYPHVDIASSRKAVGGKLRQQLLHQGYGNGRVTVRVGRPLALREFDHGSRGLKLADYNEEYFREAGFECVMDDRFMHRLQLIDRTDGRGRPHSEDSDAPWILRTKCLRLVEMVKKASRYLKEGCNQVFGRGIGFRAGHPLRSARRGGSMQSGEDLLSQDETTKRVRWRGTRD